MELIVHSRLSATGGVVLNILDELPNINPSKPGKPKKHLVFLEDKKDGSPKGLCLAEVVDGALNVSEVVEVAKARFESLERKVQVLDRVSLGYSQHVTNGYRDYINIAGTVTPMSVVATAVHDLMAEYPTFINPVTQKSNLLSINLSNQLIRLETPVNGNYWSDPGAYTLSTNDNNIPDSVPGLVEFKTVNGEEACVITAPEGYGDGAGNKRRTQVNFNAIGRGAFFFDMSFCFTENDQLPPYNAATGFGYDVLIWQLKGAEGPALSLIVRVKDNNNIQFMLLCKWSNDPNDDIEPRKQYRRVLNAEGSGLRYATSTQVLWASELMPHNQDWHDFAIETTLDERELDNGGNGKLRMWYNNTLTTVYSGPTLSIKDASGNVPDPHHWNVGIYRNESGAPAAQKELDLKRDLDPAPYTREIAFRRCRLLKAGM